MAVLAIATSSPPGVEGGHLVIARSLVAAARACGHDAHLVITPDHGFGRLASSYWETWKTDVSHVGGLKVDQVISLRYPSYAVRHPAHVCWLNHTMREYYDLWPRWTTMITPRNRVKERIRKTLLRATDAWLLTSNVTKLFAQSRTIQRRLIDELGIRPDVLWPPPPPHAYRCDAYGDYIFTLSRLTPLKRIDLLVRALAEPAAQRRPRGRRGRRRGARIARAARGGPGRQPPRDVSRPNRRRHDAPSPGQLPRRELRAVRRGLRLRHRRGVRVAQGRDHVPRQRRADRARPRRAHRPGLRPDAGGLRVRARAGERRCGARGATGHARRGAGRHDVVAGRPCSGW